MYYSFPCTYCGRVYYTYNSDKYKAAETLYYGIKQHLIDYNEDEKEHQMDDGVTIDSQEIYGKMSESNEPPSGAYELK